MVDYLTYQELHSGPKDKSNLTDEFKVESTFIKQESPSKPDIYLLPGKVLGFNLRRKKWGTYSQYMWLDHATSPRS